MNVAFAGLISFFIWTWQADCAKAGVLALGGGYLEQGDYLLHPAHHLSYQWSPDYRLRLEFMGRSFGPVEEFTLIGGMDEKLEVFPWPEFYAVLGFSIMDEYTSYKSQRGEHAEQHAFNLGANIGMVYAYRLTKSWELKLEWNSHLFAAGFAFIVLTTARKSLWTLAVGHEL